MTCGTNLAESVIPQFHFLRRFDVLELFPFTNIYDFMDDGVTSSRFLQRMDEVLGGLRAHATERLFSDFNFAMVSKNHWHWKNEYPQLNKFTCSEVV